jgi:acyl-coenzyme A thioesterase PaaI-like protein
MGVMHLRVFHAVFGYSTRYPEGNPMKADTLRRIMNLWPPFLFSGISLTRVSEDYREAEVQLKKHWYNQNYVGVHFGGSLFAMTDACYMVMLVQVLGKAYYVWDQRATIEYLKPGRGTVKASFTVTDERVREIEERTASGEKYLPEFTVEIIDAEGDMVARVVKTLYVRRKPPKPAS